MISFAVPLMAPLAFASSNSVKASNEVDIEGSAWVTLGSDAVGERLLGTFVKTPSVEVVEILAKSGLDFICLDAEHAPFDRMRLDACLAVARALDFPTLVRVPSDGADDILKVMEQVQWELLCPMSTAPKSRSCAKAARLALEVAGSPDQHAGRYATRPMTRFWRSQNPKLS
ncbi:hypothetical protein GQR58_029998 [Nymphon striatum]|nr:hypothetical protein GQR58_029998 [Nymphon striatum]